MTVDASTTRDAAPVLVLRHVPWEGLGALAPLLDARGIAWRYVDLYAGAAVPDLRSAPAVIVMGGPMSANDTEQVAFLGPEIAAIGAAVRAGVPFLGVCLGSQLLAAALGAGVAPNPKGKEIGWGPVTRTPASGSDPILRAFGAEETVLHWHGEIFDLPAGAVPLASSRLTPHQAFRWGERAWGLLFHVEADAALVAAWLAEPAMRDQAARVDPGLPEAIASQVPRHAPHLVRLQAALVDALF